jgi:hypothetical protein
LRPSYLKLLGEKGGPRDFDEVAAFAAGSELEPPVVHALASFRMRCPTLILPPSLAIPLFNIALGADSPLTAYEAVRLLGTCANTPELLHLLARCLDHPEKAVRIAAVQSLGESHDPQAGRILNERLERETDEEMLQAWRGTTTP